MLFSVATGLLGNLTRDERARMQLPSTRDGRAYNLYLKGAALLGEDTPDALPQAKALFRQAFTIDPTSAETHVSLGAVYNAQYFQGLEGGFANFDSARTHFEAAMDLDPTSPLAMRALTNLEWVQERYRTCLEIGLRALTARPRSLELETVAAEAYTLGGLEDVGLQLCQRVLRIDPSNPSARYYAVLAATWGLHNEEALNQGAEYARRFGEEPELYSWMAIAATRLRDTTRALTLARRARQITGDAGDPRVFMLGGAVEQSLLGRQAARGTWDQMRRILEVRLRTGDEQPRSSFHLMVACTVLGLRDSALSQWTCLRPLCRPDRTPGLPEGYTLLPELLIQLGQRDEAARLVAIWDRSDLGWGKWVQPDMRASYLLPEAIGAFDDPMVTAFRVRQVARMNAAAVRYRPPALD